MSFGMNSFSSLSVSGSRGSSSSMDSKENLRGLNTRLADYLAQVRALQEANSKLEAQIRERVSSRTTGERDWTQYDKTITLLREQLKELILDNGHLMLQIDNARLAADDFKVKYEAEHGVRQGVDQDVANLRKIIDETHLSRMQLESEIESLKEELIHLNKNHQEDVANLQGQIRGSSVDVQMEPKKGDNLGEIIDRIRQQYEKAAHKSREETEAWYQTKFDTVASEVSKSTETLQQGKSELNDLRRQKQVLEIDLQSLRTMNHSLEDNLRDTAARYAQEMNHHNGTVQQLEAELGEIHGQVARQGAEYQALLNIKTKLEEEIGAYHRLLEGTGVQDDGFRDTGDRRGGDVRGTGTREDTSVRGSGTRDKITIKIQDPGAWDDSNQSNIKGPGKRDDTSVNGPGTRDGEKIQGPVTHDDDGDLKDSDLGPEDTNDKIGNTGVPEDDLVEFSLEQALNAAPPVPPAPPLPTPSQTLESSEEVREAVVVEESHSEPKLNTANGGAEEEEKKEEEEEKRGRDGGEEEAAVLEENKESLVKSAAVEEVLEEEERGRDVIIEEEAAVQEEEKILSKNEEEEVEEIKEEKQAEEEPEAEVEVKQEEVEAEVVEVKPSQNEEQQME
ncbi:keratin, type I cytoskeletal 18 [Astyanax mexicanus]|uniref:keratin, type I cytoskeletal 18 n=1 Tax=Astyanax mexicanus TaxID=7994 RepID=UPI0020CB015B|nr:keratin, type I cytoskeletal 18 [Astyanax mexicanus]